MARAKQFDQEEVLNRAMNLFWEKGYHATSMQDLIENLGINRASLYDTYGSKKELYDRTLKKYQDEELKTTADFLYYQTNIRQGFYLLFEQMIDTALKGDNSHGCFLVNAITELANSDDRIGELVKENKIAFEEMYVNYLQYGLNQGQISPYKELKSTAAYLYEVQTGIKVISKIQLNKEELLKTVSLSLTVLD